MRTCGWWHEFKLPEVVALAWGSAWLPQRAWEAYLVKEQMPNWQDPQIVCPNDSFELF
jgi:hypothetical protein